jgi:nicotinamidase/pyrazinamidase
VQLGYGEQVLWPDHCVQGTAGAGFHPALEAVAAAELIVRKGYNRSVDSYSAFRENDKRTPTGLAGYLRERGLRRCVFAGLAYDFCVRYSAEDAVAAGFEAVVIEDACRGIGLPSGDGDTIDDARRAFVQRGIVELRAADVV